MDRIGELMAAPPRPTREMVDAGMRAFLDAGGNNVTNGQIALVYRAMLAAMPEVTPRQLLAARALAGEAAIPQEPIDEFPAALHPQTARLVRRFAHALAIKLRAAERKYGYSDGWRDAGWMDECRAKLLEHVAKGDPRDVAAYCAFLWHHGASTAPSPVVAAGVGEPVAPADPLKPPSQDVVNAAVRAYVQAGKRGVTGIQEAMRFAIEAAHGEALRAALAAMPQGEPK